MCTARLGPFQSRCPGIVNDKSQSEQQRVSAGGEWHSFRSSAESKRAVMSRPHYFLQLRLGIEVIAINLGYSDESSCLEDYCVFHTPNVQLKALPDETSLPLPRKVDPLAPLRFHCALSSLAAASIKYASHHARYTCPGSLSDACQLIHAVLWCKFGSQIMEV